MNPNYQPNRNPRPQQNPQNPRNPQRPQQPPNPQNRPRQPYPPNNRSAAGAVPRSRPQNGPNLRQNPQNPGNPQHRQNPQNRQSRQNPAQSRPRPNLPPEEIARRQELARQRREWMQEQKRIQEQRDQAARAHQKEMRKKEFAENAKILGGRLLVFFVVLLILGLVAAGVFWAFFRSAPDAPPDSGNLTYFYGGSETRKSPVRDSVVGDSLYFCFNDLSDYLGMAESGTAQALKFVLPQTARDPDNADTSAGDGYEEYILFTTDNRRVNINGQDIQLDLPSILRETEVWVSSAFLTDYMNGVSLEYREKNGDVLISRIRDEEASDGKNVVYLPVSFQLKNALPVASIEEDPLIGDLTYGDGEDGTIDLNFTTNLSEYEKFMNPTGDMRDEFLILVNPDHQLADSDVPEDLVDVSQTSASKNTQQLRLYAARALDALYIEMRAAGFYDMAVYSGYRSFSYQAILFDQYTDNEMSSNSTLTRDAAEEIVLTYSTRPGTSEHQTGLAVDMDTMGAFSTDFAYTAEYEWLKENAWKFGFILRFPEEKFSVTHIQFEPWHYRYVGRYHASKMHETGLCLEEYVAKLGK